MSRLEDITNSFYEMTMNVSRSKPIDLPEVMCIAVAYSQNWGRNSYGTLEDGKVEIRGCGYLDGREKEEIHNRIYKEIEEGIGSCEVVTNFDCLDFLPWDSFTSEKKGEEKHE